MNINPVTLGQSHILTYWFILNKIPQPRRIYSIGASVMGITALLWKQLIRLVLIANIIAWPIAYYFMHKWLQDSAYRTGVSLWIFGLAGLITTDIALLTISTQTIKAATANPVDSLRYE
jgi:putative ABC transport system permease protein